MRIKVDPLVRIEGHLKIETTVEDGVVENAQVSGQMYRGIERLLRGRHPIDAARIAQRTCGVCHEVHGVASVMALEALYGIEPPSNGKLLRDMILGLHIVTDHLLHFYGFCVPDYVDFTAIQSYTGTSKDVLQLKNWLSKSGNHYADEKAPGQYIKDQDTAIRIALNYFKMIQIRSAAGAGIAIVGAKTPFAHALLPGGITTKITADSIMRYYDALKTTAAFIREQYLPDVLSLSAAFEDYFDIGTTYDQFYCNTFFTEGKSPLMKGGVLMKGKRNPFLFANVKERLDASYIDDDGAPNENKQNAYSWIKAPRYDGTPLEVGPIARAVLNDDVEFLNLRQRFKGDQKGSSVMSRLLARAVEAKRVTDHLYDLVDQYQLGKPTIQPFDFSTPVTGRGSAFSMASRGALSHHIVAEKGKIVNYHMMVPSTWNFGPTIEGTAGIVEKALIGTHISGHSDQHCIELGRVVRSFDPCTACSVH